MSTPEYTITFESGNRLLILLQRVRYDLHETHGFLSSDPVLEDVNAAIRIVTGEDSND